MVHNIHECNLYKAFGESYLQLFKRLVVVELSFSTSQFPQNPFYKEESDQQSEDEKQSGFRIARAFVNSRRNTLHVVLFE